VSAASKLTAARAVLTPVSSTAAEPRDLPMRDFAHSLPMALLKAREAVMAGFRPDLEAHGLTEQQWRVLRVLTEHPGISAGELADRAALLKPSLSRIVGRLEERGLVERRPGERDLRLARLTMTVTGHRLVRTIAPRSEARYSAIEAAFGRERLAELHGMLEELMASLEPREVRV
jgi:homoprotocatechuate degradation regulator HpaR